MLWGFRRHAPNATPAIALARTSSADGSALPRRAVQMTVRAPGSVIERNRGVQLRNFARLGIGDLVLFDAVLARQSSSDLPGTSASVGPLAPLRLERKRWRPALSTPR
jgi:hypothetical protein